MNRNPDFLLLDAASGIAGDMFLAALLDAGVPRQELEATLHSLPLPRFEMKVESVRRAGLRALHVTFAGTAGGGRVVQRLADARAVIAGGSLSARASSVALSMFAELFAAEARVHGESPEDAHLHEIGDLDSVLDIVGSAVALDMLGWPEIYLIGPLRTGTGAVATAHGILPVPAPATVELLRGVDVPLLLDGDGELVTPTGALMIRTHCRGVAGAARPGSIVSVGHGAGGRDTPARPNVVRVFLVSAAAADPAEADLHSAFASLPDDVAQDEVIELRAHLDDATGEELGELVNMLSAVGALDVGLLPGVGKRGRPLTAVTVLCPAARAAALATVLFRDSPTLGVRFAVARRLVLARDVISVPVDELGEIPVKIAYLGGKPVKAKVEWRAAVEAAASSGDSARTVCERTLAAARRLGLLP
ncbi:MAG: nickel pincer cofactor biosynthesis protein LarC [Candidatus Schekmanbacteria bacterium]|nr:nickel pincer cofactor biosynthesis protein LarC [Candidatus Schekmanbacteria bacterium]